MLKIKEGIPLRVLLHYGFKYDERGFYCYTRIIDSIVAWKLYVSKNHHYLQIKVYEPCIMASQLQSILYDLIIDGLVEKVEE